MEEKDWPDFLKKYPEAIRIECYTEFAEIAKKYRRDIDRINNGLGPQGPINGTAKNAREAALDRVKFEYGKEAQQVAKTLEEKEISNKKAELSKEEKLAQMKENFADEQPESRQKEAKAKSQSVFSDEKKSDIEFDAQENKEEVTKKADEERAKFIAEIKAAKERNQSKERDR